MNSFYQQALDFYAKQDFERVISILEPLAQDNQLHAPTWFLIGMAYGQQKNFMASQRALEVAVKLDPHQANYWLNLGAVLQHQKEYDVALQCYQQVLTKSPASPEVYKNLGQLYQEKNQPFQAIQFFKKAIKLRPHFILARYHLANLLFELNKLEQAVSEYEILVNYQFFELDSYLKLAQIYLDGGKVSQAVNYFKAALAFTNDRETKLKILSNLIFIQRATFLSHIEKKTFIRSYGKLMKQDEQWVFSSSKSTHKPLKIGYVASTFYNHSSVAILDALFSYHQRQFFEIYMYSHVEESQQDPITERFKALSYQWYDINQLSDREAAELIHSHHIDILVDLVGHGASNRLEIFAYRPAPIQMTGLGYGETTGLQAMDYLITDSHLKPIKSSVYHSEKLVYINTLMRWAIPSISLAAIRKSPTKSVVFGCGNELFKLNDEVLVCWAGILEKLPDALLAIKATALDQSYYKENLYRDFEKLGIERSRLSLQGKTSRQEHLAFYQGIDIALDPFPYHGGISSCDALWMGLPLISLSMGTRTGNSLLNPLQRTEWIANTVEEYIQKSVELTKNIADIRCQRVQLRKMFEQSIICDRKGFVSQIEKVYRSVWLSQCGV